MALEGIKAILLVMAAATYQTAEPVTVLVPSPTFITRAPWLLPCDFVADTSVKLVAPPEAVVKHRPVEPAVSVYA